jgi:hypothetical protein
MDPKAYPVALFAIAGRGVVLLFDVGREAGNSIDVRQGDLVEITKQDGSLVRSVVKSVECLSSSPEKCPLCVLIDLAGIAGTEFDGAVASIVRPTLR